MVATPQGTVNRRPLNAAVKPCGGVRPKSLPIRQGFSHDGQTVAVRSLSPQTPREQGVDGEV
jgi:hypothetical protein